MEKIKRRLENVNEIKRILKEKYNEEFEVLRVGNRYGEERLDLIQAYCSPQENRDIVFKMTADVNGKKEFEEDDYYIKYLTTQLDTQIKEQLDSIKTIGCSRTETIKKNRLDRKIDINEFINEYPNANFLSIIVISEEIDKNSLLNAFDKIKDQNKGIKLNSIIYQISDEEYTSLKDNFDTMSYISRTPIEDNGYINRWFISIENNEVKNIGE